MAAILAALCLTTTCAFAQTSGTQAQETQSASATNAQTDEASAQAEDDTNADMDSEDFIAGQEVEATAQDDAQDADEADETADTDEAADEQKEKDPVSDKVKALINSLELEPQTTGDDELDAMVTEILAEIITEEMDTYQQVKACYDYLLSNMNYSWSSGRYYTNVAGSSVNALFTDYGRITGYGALALSTNKGQCNDYASGFILLTRALGIDSYLANGQTIASGGRYIRHYWVEMEIDGTRYIFDPQLEQSLEKYGKQPYGLFCKTYGQVGSRYVYYNRTAA